MKNGIGPNLIVVSPGANGPEIKGGSLSLEMLQEIGLADRDRDRKENISVHEAWTAVAWYRRCIDVIGTTVASMPFDIMKGDKVIGDHLSPPPDPFSWLDLWDMKYRYATSLVMAGKAASLKNFDGRSRIPTALTWWKPDSWKPVKTAAGIETLERTVGTRKRKVPAELVVHAYTPDPFVEQGVGSSDGFAAKINAQILADLDEFTSNQLRSGLVKKVVFTAEGYPPGEEERFRIKQYLKRWLFGTKPTPPEVMFGGIEPREIGSDLSSIANAPISEQQQKTIATGLGIPHSVVMSDASNYATASADQVNFIAFKIGPLDRIVTRAMNFQLLDVADYRIVPRPDKLEVMQRIEFEKAQAVAQLTPGPIMLIEEGRALLDLPDLTPEQLSQLTNTGHPAQVNITAAKSTEVRAWRKCVEKYGRDYKFVPNSLTKGEADVIRERLAAEVPIGQAFEPPYADF